MTCSAVISSASDKLNRARNRAALSENFEPSVASSIFIPPLLPVGHAKIKPCDNEQRAAEPLRIERKILNAFRAYNTLRQPDGQTSNEDQNAMAHSIHKKERAPVQDIALCGNVGEDHGEHRRSTG